MRKQGAMDAFSRNQWRHFFFVCTVFVGASFFPGIALGSGAGYTPLADALCTGVRMFTGPFGRALVTLSIIFLGTQALFGRVSWGPTILNCCGVATMYGAADMVTALGGMDADCSGAYDSPITFMNWVAG